MLSVQWVAEDWAELTNRIRTDREIINRDAILELIAAEKNPDRQGAGHPAAVPERVCLYPFGDLSAAAGREFPL